MLPAPASLSIIIVNWNGGDLLRRCVESIVQSPPGIAYEIVVVDNASTDDSVPRVRSAATRAPLRVIEHAENAGFSRANNRAIAESRAELVLLLNPDTEVTPGAIDTLIATLWSEASNGACGPRLVHPDGALQPSAWRNPPSAWETVIAGAGLWRLLPPRVRGWLLLGGHWDHAARRSVPMLFGAALLVKREVIDAVGAFDERFHMYAEDHEWCLRIRRGGWRVIFEPAATVVHHGGFSAQQRWTGDNQLRVRLAANFDFQRRCLSPAHYISNLAAGCVVSALQRVWRLVRGIPADEIAIVFEMYAAALKRIVRDRGDAGR